MLFTDGSIKNATCIYAKSSIECFHRNWTAIVKRHYQKVVPQLTPTPAFVPHSMETLAASFGVQLITQRPRPCRNQQQSGRYSCFVARHISPSEDCLREQLLNFPATGNVHGDLGDVLTTNLIMQMHRTSAHVLNASLTARMFWKENTSLLPQ